jgi:hypothetical protein
MVSEILANYIGNEERSFTDKNGKEVRYSKLSFLCHGEEQPFTMGLRSGVTIENIKRFEEVVLMIDWNYNTKTGFWNPKVIKVLQGKEATERHKRVDVSNTNVGTNIKA